MFRGRKKVENSGSRVCVCSNIEKIRVSHKIYFISRDFAGGPDIKTLPSSTGDAGLIPDQGIKIPHATGCGKKSMFYFKRLKHIL